MQPVWQSEVCVWAQDFDLFQCEAVQENQSSTFMQETVKCYSFSQHVAAEVRLCAVEHQFVHVLAVSVSFLFTSVFPQSCKIRQIDYWVCLMCLLFIRRCTWNPLCCYLLKLEWCIIKMYMHFIASFFSSTLSWLIMRFVLQKMCPGLADVVHSMISSKTNTHSIQVVLNNIWLLLFYQFVTW